MLRPKLVAIRDVEHMHTLVERLETMKYSLDMVVADPSNPLTDHLQYQGPRSANHDFLTFIRYPNHILSSLP